MHVGQACKQDWHTTPAATRKYLSTGRRQGHEISSKKMILTNTKTKKPGAMAVPSQGEARIM